MGTRLTAAIGCSADLMAARTDKNLLTGGKVSYGKYRIIMVHHRGRIGFPQSSQVQSEPCVIGNMSLQHDSRFALTEVNGPKKRTNWDPAGCLNVNWCFEN